MRRKRRRRKITQREAPGYTGKQGEDVTQGEAPSHTCKHIEGEGRGGKSFRLKNLSLWQIIKDVTAMVQNALGYAASLGKQKTSLLREATKKVIFLMAGPLRPYKPSSPRA